MPENINTAGAPNIIWQQPSVRNPDEYHLEELAKGLQPPAAAGANGERGNGSTSPMPTAEQENAPPVERWEVSVLSPRHREIMRRILEGATQIEIAEAMGIHKQTVNLVVTSPLFKAELAKLEAQADFHVVQRAESMSNEALDKLKVLMRTARSEFIQRQCAERILDTAGYSKVERKIIGVVSGEDVIREMNKRRREKMKEFDASGGEDDSGSP